MNFGKMFKKNLKKNNILAVLFAIIVIFLVVYLVNMLLRSTCFKNHLENMENGNDSKKIVYYYMNGCGHCEKFSPIWDAFVSSYTGSLTLSKKEQGQMTQDENDKYKIQGFPTVLAIDENGQKTDEFNGERSKEGLDIFVKANE